MKLLIEHKANINPPSRTNQNALIAAILNEHYEVVKFLIENGADVREAKDNKNRTLLMIAQKSGLTNV